MDTHISQVEDPGTRSRPLEADLSQGYVQKIFEDFPALIWRAGLDMKCDYFNWTWLEFTGRSISLYQN